MELGLGEHFIPKPEIFPYYVFFDLIVIGARHLPKMELFGTIHSFVSVEYLSPCDGKQVQVVTEVIEGYDPIFNHTVRIGPIEPTGDVAFHIVEWAAKKENEKIAAAYVLNSPFKEGKQSFVLQLRKHHHPSEHSKESFLDLEVKKIDKMDCRSIQNNPRLVASIFQPHVEVFFFDLHKELDAPVICMVQFSKFEKVDIKILVTHFDDKKHYCFDYETYDDRPFYEIKIRSNFDGTKLYTLGARDGGFKSRLDVFKEVSIHLPARLLKWETLKIVVSDIVVETKKSLQDVLDGHGWNKIEGSATYTSAKKVCTDCLHDDMRQSIMFDESNFFYKSDWEEKDFDECVYLKQEDYGKYVIDLTCQEKTKRTVKIYKGKHYVLGKDIALRVSVDAVGYGEVLMKEFYVTLGKVTKTVTSGKFFEEICPF